MPACERLHGWRVVADPAALDHLAWASPSPESFVLRLAPDDALVVGASGAPTVDDPNAIVEPDAGWCGITMGEEAFAAGPGHHVEWRLPTARPALAQGLLATVPVKLWFADGTVTIVFARAYEHELMERLP